MKRLLSLLLIVIAVFGCLSGTTVTVSAIADYTSGSTGDCTWIFDNVSGELSIKSTNSYNQKLYGYNYGKSPWFSFKDSIKSITVDSKIYSIGDNCFTDCTSLENVYMPGVYEVGDYAFEGCEQLKKVELSSEYIQTGKVGKYAFAFCSSLNKILLPFRSITIHERAFFCCENLETLGIYTFAKIETEAFLACPKLSSIYMLNNGSPFSYNYSSNGISNTAFSGVKADVYYHYPYAPRENNVYGGQFTYINTTSGIVGYDAFWDYDRQNERLTITGTGKLFNYSSGNDLPWMDFATENTFDIRSIKIEDGITDIPSYSFEYMNKVESVTLPNTLLRLQPNAFRVCESLTEITLPASLEYVDGSKYWYRCENLKDVYYVGTEQEWNEIYDLSNTYIAERITPHFLVYHPSTQTCNKAGYPAHYEFDGTAKDTFYDLNKVATPAPEPKKLEHSFSGDWTKDTSGHWHTCTLCKTAISDKADHIYDDPCDEICNICGYTREVKHTVVTVKGYPATCTDDGLSDGSYCSDCGKVLTEQTVIPKTGHKPVIDEAVKATCRHDGLTVGSHCEYCGLVYVEQTVIPRLEHTPEEDEAVPPKCAENGLTAGSHCSVCGEIIIAQQIIPALQHDYMAVVGVKANHFHPGMSDGIQCSRCGEWLIEQQVLPQLEGSPLLGDADDDGEVGIIDAAIVQRAATHIKVLFTEEQLLFADVDGDGELTVLDATYIQRFATRVKVPYPVGQAF